MDNDLDFARSFLTRLTDKIKPGNGQRHNLTINDDGQLEVTLMSGSLYLPIIIEGIDLTMEWPELVDKIVREVTIEKAMP